MKYLCCKWKHNIPGDPVLLYSELDEQRLEIRKLEIWPDGRCGYADQTTVVGGTSLGIVEVGSLEEIARDPQFEPSEITREDFEELWTRREGSIALVRDESMDTR